MNDKSRFEKRAQQWLCRLFLTAILGVTISAGKADMVNVAQAAGVIGQQQLELGRAVEREIAEGETHSYRVHLAAGEFIHIIIYQRGVNVAATLIAPDGKKKLLEADAPRSMQEAEWITHVPTTAGEYSIDARTVGTGAPPGRYEIKIEEKRRSVPGDETRLSAQRAFTDGTRLFGEKNYPSAIEKYQEALGLYRQSGRRAEEAVTLNCLALSSYLIFEYQAAIERYKEALSIYREVSDLQGQGFTLNEIGEAYSIVRRYDEAINYYEQALEARRKTGYRAGEGGTLSNLGVVYRDQGRNEKAIEYFEQTLAIIKEVKDRKGEGRVLTDLGHTYKSLGRYEKAIEYYKQALSISQDLNNRTGEANSLVGLGNAYNSQGQYEKAIEHYEQAVTISREIKFLPSESNSLVGLGNAYHNQGRYEKAIEYLEQALTISTKSRVAQGRILNNLGDEYIALNRYEKAIEYLEQALVIKRELRDRAAEGNTLGNIATVYNYLRRFQKAIEYYEQQLAISRDVKDPRGEGSALWGLGDAYNLQNQYQKAIGYYEQSLVIFRRLGNRKEEGGTLNGLGEAYRNLSQYENAIECHKQALAISREVKDRAGEGHTLNDLMLVWERHNNSPVAIIYGKQAVNVFQEIRGNIKTLDKESQQSYLKSHEAAYRRLADLLISQGRLAEAEKVLELLKEEEFNRITRRNGPADSKIGLTKTEAEAAKIDDQLASLASERGPLLAKTENKSATEQDRQRLDQIDSAIREANTKINLVLAEVAKAAPDDSLMTEQSQSMMQSLRKLGQGAVALYTVVTNEKGWVMLSTPDFRRAYPIETTGLNKTISDFRLTLKSDRYDPVPLAQKLYSALFLQKNTEGATLAADLKSYRARTLMWALDGVLRYVPIGALHDGKGYLVERYPNLVFTTASLTRLLDTGQRKWRGFGLGVSKEYKDFPALTAVPRELHSIISETRAPSRGVLPGVIRLDEQFTRKSMIEGLREGYPVVHIASHFRFNAERQETSFLLLGDGSYLTLEEMQNSPGIFEKVELLTLSACDTATNGANGKEVEGLAYVAQNLGAKAVVASLWPVADVGTEVLMREFYRLKRANPLWSKAESLRQAQIALLKGKVSSSGAIEDKRGPTINDEKGMRTYKRDAKTPFAHPHYWAPFVLIGNWR